MVDFIEVYEDSLDPQLCADIIDEFNHMVDSSNPGVKYNNNDTYDGFRQDTQIHALKHDSWKPYTDAIKDSLALTWSQYNRKYWPDPVYERDMDPIPFSRVFHEDIKIQYSPPGGGYCSWHCEQGRGKVPTLSRFAVWIIYLNDVPEGGATQFRSQDVEYQPTTGTTVIWPAAYTHFHRSSPDLKSDKYIATGWFCYGQE